MSWRREKEEAFTEMLSLLGFLQVVLEFFSILNIYFDETFSLVDLFTFILDIINSNLDPFFFFFLDTF